MIGKNETMAIIALGIGMMYFKDNDAPDLNRDGVTDNSDKMWLLVGAVALYFYFN
jgi:hypothetical protein